jgi:hypothetical protein
MQMDEVIHKQIQYDTFSVDIIEKDSRTYLHFQGYSDGPFLDKSIKDTFCRPVKNTGEDIEKEFKEYLQKNSIPVDETKYFDINYFKDEEEFFSVRKLMREKHAELLKKYDDKSYIHKSTVEKLNIEKDSKGKIYQVSMPNRVTSYIVPEKNPFIDTLMVNLAAELNKHLTS